MLIHSKYGTVTPVAGLPAATNPLTTITLHKTDPATAAGPRQCTLADCCCPSLRGENAATLRLLTVCASISGALFGYDTGVVSGAIQLIKQDFRGPHNEEMSTALMELIVSITVGMPLTIDTMASEPTGGGGGGSEL